MKAVIVLAMHGSPPEDFPKNEMVEFFGLHARMEHASLAAHTSLERRYAELEARMRNWPRTPKNDPFHAASQELAIHLRRATGRKVILGFNEFCAPSVEEALDLAAGQSAEKVIVITPMMTRGGGHSERDIPAAIKTAQERHPSLKFIYAWPFSFEDIASFLASQAERFL